MGGTLIRQGADRQEGSIQRAIQELSLYLRHFTMFSVIVDTSVTPHREDQSTGVKRAELAIKMLLASVLSWPHRSISMPHPGHLGSLMVGYIQRNSA